MLKNKKFPSSGVKITFSIKKHRKTVFFTPK